MTLHQLAHRFLDQIHELPGNRHNPFIQWAHSLSGLDISTPDEVPWCSSFVNVMAWILELPRSGSAGARSWLKVGTPTDIANAQAAYDVVILKRGQGPQPGPEVTSGATGHVGIFSGVGDGGVWVLGGNQRNAVTRQWFPLEQILGIRRLKQE